MTSDRWKDLRQRVLSALVLATVGIGSVVLGGLPFAVFVALLTGVMVWELVSISNSSKRFAMGMAIVAALAVFVDSLIYWLPELLDSYGAHPGLSALFLLAGFIHLVVALVLLLVVPVALGIKAKANKIHVGLYSIGITVSGLFMLNLRFEIEVVWVLWLALVVVATDVAGYFAGRTIGGPKFWPAISPKKTWSGVIAGWIAAGVVGAMFDVALIGPLVLLSMLVSFASQMGDIAESSIKRKFDVKDSSNLIPGHGGFLDRFDAMIAATLVLGILSLVMPGGLHFFEMGWG